MSDAKKTYHHGDLAVALLKAAEVELSETGIEKFSLRAVAKRAGVSHGAPAHHFGDARGLLTALAADGYKRLLSVQTAREVAAGSDPRDVLIASGLGYLDFAQANPELFRLMFNSSIPNREDARFFDIALAVFDHLVDRIQSVTQKNPYEDKDSMLDLMTSWSVVHGLAELLVSGRAERPLNLASLTDVEKEAALVSILDRANRSILV
ncbi:TetR/AcrR family transcriptional regulator [Ponticaulis profundi]|uniref:TetR/AcrR family transcriptional regulator n=1 Tax=Ponticaulis profundi TaxID=2665222 RepID=A0ABW1S941_9PROT